MLTMPTLESARVLIRPFILDDFDALHRILDLESGAVAADDAAGLAAARTARRAWIEWSVRNYVALARLHQPPYGDRAIVLRTTGSVIGACGLAPVQLPFGQLPCFGGSARSPRARNTNEMGLFWEVSLRHRRHGYATEAGAVLIRYAFTVLNLQRIVATTTYDNAASIGVMRRLGMSIQQNPQPEPATMQVVGVLENL